MKKALIFLLTSISVLLTGCQKASYLKFDKEEISIPKDGGKMVVGIHSDASNYNVEHSPEWTKVNVEDSCLVCEVLANSAQAIRKDSIVISCGGLTKAISIIQYYNATYIRTTNQLINFGIEGGSQVIAVETDGANVIVPDLPAGYSTDYTSGKLTITAPHNDGRKIDEYITLQSDAQSTTIALKQEGNVCSRCHGKGKIKCPICNGLGYTYNLRGDYMYFSCTYCGGDGQEVPENPDPYYRDGSGKITCPQCNGKGY